MFEYLLPIGIISLAILYRKQLKLLAKLTLPINQEISPKLQTEYADL